MICLACSSSGFPFKSNLYPSTWHVNDNSYSGVKIMSSSSKSIWKIWFSIDSMLYTLENSIENKTKSEMGWRRKESIVKNKLVMSLNPSVAGEASACKIFSIFSKIILDTWNFYQLQLTLSLMHSPYTVISWHMHNFDLFHPKLIMCAEPDFEKGGIQKEGAGAGVLRLDEKAGSGQLFKDSDTYGRLAYVRWCNKFEQKRVQIVIIYSWVPSNSLLYAVKGGFFGVSCSCHIWGFLVRTKRFGSACQKLQSCSISIRVVCWICHMMEFSSTHTWVHLPIAAHWRYGIEGSFGARVATSVAVNAGQTSNIVIFLREYVFKIGIHFEKSSDIWPRHRHHNAQNYWSSGEPSLPRYVCIYCPSEISSFTVVVENVFTLTVRVLTHTAEFCKLNVVSNNPHYLVNFFYHPLGEGIWNIVVTTGNFIALTMVLFCVQGARPFWIWWTYGGWLVSTMYEAW